jgi:hypothetical protein
MGLDSDKPGLKYCSHQYLLYNFSFPIWKEGNNSEPHMQVGLVELLHAYLRSFLILKY